MAAAGLAARLKPVPIGSTNTRSEAGSRLAARIRRAGLLKAVGASPTLVAVVLLAQYLAVALAAAGAGLLAGRLLAPALTHLSFFSGLAVTPGASALTPATVGLVVASAALITEASDHEWVLVAITAICTGLTLTKRIHPLWALGFGALAGWTGIGLS